MLERLKGLAGHWEARLRRVYLVDLVWRAVQTFQKQQSMTYAAAMSYYVLFSLFPLLIAIVAVFGLLLRDPAQQDRVVQAIVAQIPAEFDMTADVERVVGGVARTENSLLGLIGLAGTLWTASNMFAALRRALNLAFAAPGARNFVHGKLVDLVSVFGVLGLIVLSLAATATLGIIRGVQSELFTGALINIGWAIAYFLLPLCISFVAFLLVYRWIPNLTTGFSYLWIGALLAAVGFEITKGGFGLYVANFGNYQEVYGAIGGVVAFLFFVFITANIVIFAATLTAEVMRDRVTPRAAPPVEQPAEQPTV